ncbi:DUF6093 family protein [Arthrobacter koreensis]|uniref:DUF6093 family protein n=1 Tax=Arthrobacter koreensis TaxID=199136 RepID=UPI0036DEFC12
MSPLPGWNVIPPGWAEHHQPTNEGTQTAEAVFKRISGGPAPYPLPPGWDGAEVIWSANVRVQELKREGRGEHADQPTHTREYLISAPAGGPPIRSGEQGDVIHVLGRSFRVISEQFGSLAWGRDFTCVDNLTQQNP